MDGKKQELAAARENNERMLESIRGFEDKVRDLEVWFTDDH